MRIIAVLAVAFALASCSSNDTTETSEPSSTSSSSSSSATPVSTTAVVPPPASVAPTTTAAPAPASNLRAQTCRDVLPLFNELRSTGTGAVEKAAQETIDWFPTTPEWAGLSETDRQATIAGVRDAEAGSCQ